MKMPAEPDIDMLAPLPGANDGKGLLLLARQRMPGGAWRQVWRCICGECGRSDVAVHNTADSAIVANNLKRRGWRGFGKRIRCPACVTARQPATPPCPAPASLPPAPERSATMSADTAPANILNAAKIGRHLDIYWLDTPGRYDEGWSDERIGRELGGISPDFVRLIREGLGKTFKRPPELDEAARILERAETVFVGATSDIDNALRELREELERLEGEVGARLEALKDAYLKDVRAAEALIAQADAKVRAA